MPKNAIFLRTNPFLELFHANLTIFSNPRITYTRTNPLNRALLIIHEQNPELQLNTNISNQVLSDICQITSFLGGQPAYPLSISVSTSSLGELRTIGRHALRLTPVDIARESGVSLTSPFSIKSQRIGGTLTVKTESVALILQLNYVHPKYTV